MRGRRSSNYFEFMKPAKLHDGIYQVKTRYLCAAFVVSGGEVVECAPILRARLEYWMTVARRVEDVDRRHEER